MKIAFVNNRHQLGGAETVAWQLLRGAEARGHAARFYVGETAERDLPRGAERLYPDWLLRLYHSRMHGWVRRYAGPRRVTSRRLARLGGAHDLVHVHNFHGIYASTASLAELAARAPVVWTFHRFWGVTGGCDHPGECIRYLDTCGACPRVNEWPINGRDNTSEQLAEKEALLGRAPITVVSPSEHLARTVRGSRVGAGWRVEVIPNGVDPGEFAPAEGDRGELRAALGLSREKSVVLAVNRSFADPLKGGDILASAAAGLDFRRVQLVLAGGDAEGVRSRLPEGADVVLAGYVRERSRLADLLRVADVFLYASPRENFPCATLEAMTAGCCVVSTPTDGVLEQIRDGEHGVFAEDFSGAALARAANAVLADRQRARALGAAARERVRREFTEAGMVERHLALYAELIAARRGRRTTS
jgi:glycosyltransferase involved in cell wall biosynthesis